MVLRCQRILVIFFIYHRSISESIDFTGFVAVRGAIHCPPLCISLHPWNPRGAMYCPPRQQSDRLHPAAKRRGWQAAASLRVANKRPRLTRPQKLADNKKKPLSVIDWRGRCRMRQLRSVSRLWLRFWLRCCSARICRNRCGCAASICLYSRKSASNLAIASLSSSVR